MLCKLVCSYIVAKGTRKIRELKFFHRWDAVQIIGGKGGDE